MNNREKKLLKLLGVDKADITYYRESRNIMSYSSIVVSIQSKNKLRILYHFTINSSYLDDYSANKLVLERALKNYGKDRN